MSEKLLDILIPAYGHPDGVAKILALVSSDKRANIIVSDDSSKKSDIKTIKELCALSGVTYKKGPQSGAVSNWNFLYDLCPRSKVVGVKKEK